MNLDLVITHLRENVPIFGGRVAGAAEFARAIQDQVWMDLPACYVRPLDEDASENTSSNSLRQMVTERIGVVVEFDNASDRRGQASSAQYDDMRRMLWAALLNWRVDPVRASRGLELAGGRYLDMDRARLFYQWDYSLELTVTDADGWQLNPDPLLVIDQKFVRDGVVDAEAFITLPQS